MARDSEHLGIEKLRAELASVAMDIAPAGRGGVGAAHGRSARGEPQPHSSQKPGLRVVDVDAAF